MFRKLTLFSVFLTLIIVVLGSVIRLWEADSGLLNVTMLEILKGTCHDYLTAALGLSILVMWLLSWRQQQNKFAAIITSVSLLILVALQAALGFLAKAIVTMPVVIVMHISLGMITFWLLYWLYLRSNPAIIGWVSEKEKVRKGLVNITRVAMVFLWIQIVLGAWVSANHAALACSGFPQCNGQWWPNADYLHAFDFVNGLLTGYNGVIAFDAQVAANWLHRIGALLNFLLLSTVMLSATATHSKKSVRTAGLWLGVLLFVQIGLAIIATKMAIPFWATPVHHAVAALLMLPLIAISFYSRFSFEERQPPELIAAKPKPEQKILEAAKVAVSVEIIEETYVEPPAESLYVRLKSQLKRTRSGLSGILASLPIGQKEINDDLLEEIEASLLMADVGIDATTEIIGHLTKNLERNQLADGVALSLALKEELTRILKPCSSPLKIPKQDTPFVILVVGVNGAGKTTTIGKLAKRLQAQGHSVMLAAGDTFRAAAVEQLQVWGERNKIHVVAQHTGADSASVIYDGLQSAKAKGIDVLIADTAGRLHTKSNLMDELKKVKRIMGRLDEHAPHEVLLVLDAGTGQNALSQAKLFNEAVALSGLVLTKLDGTAKGGVIFALAKHTGIPIRFIGIGEGIDDLQDFDAELFVDALFVKD